MPDNVDKSAALLNAIGPPAPVAGDPSVGSDTDPTVLVWDTSLKAPVNIAASQYDAALKSGNYAPIPGQGNASLNYRGAVTSQPAGIAPLKLGGGTTQTKGERDYAAHSRQDRRDRLDNASGWGRTFLRNLTHVASFGAVTDNSVDAAIEDDVNTSGAVAGQALGYFLPGALEKVGLGAAAKALPLTHAERALARAAEAAIPAARAGSKAELLTVAASGALTNAGVVAGSELTSSAISSLTSDKPFAASHATDTLGTDLILGGALPVAAKLLGKAAGASARAMERQGIHDLGSDASKEARAAFDDALDVHYRAVEEYGQRLDKYQVLDADGHLPPISKDLNSARAAALQDAKKAQDALQKIDLHEALSADASPKDHLKARKLLSDYQAKVAALGDAMRPHPLELQTWNGAPGVVDGPGPAPSADVKVGSPEAPYRDQPNKAWADRQAKAARNRVMDAIERGEIPNPEWLHDAGMLGEMGGGKKVPDGAVVGSKTEPLPPEGSVSDATNSGRKPVAKEPAPAGGGVQDPALAPTMPDMRLADTVRLPGIPEHWRGEAHAEAGTDGAGAAEAGAAQDVDPHYQLPRSELDIIRSRPEYLEALSPEQTSAGKKAGIPRSGDAITSEMKVHTVSAESIARRGYSEPEAGFDSGVRLEKARQAIKGGQRDPIQIAVGPDGSLEVIDGRHRLRAAIELGKDVKVVYVKGSAAGKGSGLVMHGSKSVPGLHEGSGGELASRLAEADAAGMEAERARDTASKQLYKADQVKANKAADKADKKFEAAKVQFYLAAGVPRPPNPMAAEYMRAAEADHPAFKVAAETQHAVARLHKVAGEQMTHASALEVAEGLGAKIGDAESVLAQKAGQLWAVRQVPSVVAEAARGAKVGKDSHDGVRNLLVRRLAARAGGKVGAAVLGGPGWIVGSALGGAGGFSSAVAKAHKALVNVAAKLLNPTSARVLARTIASMSEDKAYSYDGTPPTKDVAARIQQLHMIAADPAAARERIMSAPGIQSLMHADPEVGGLVVDNALKRAQYLSISAPHYLMQAWGITPPAASEVRRFKLKERCANDAGYALHLLESGVVTPDVVDTIRACHPEVASMLNETLLADPDTLMSLPRARLKQIELITGVPLTPTADPAAVARQQARSQLSVANAQLKSQPSTSSGGTNPQPFSGPPLPSQAIGGRAPGN